MTEEQFNNFLERRRVLGYKYKNGDLAGLVNVWFHAGKYVLTWEECKDGDQLNENNYTRDERHEFLNTAAVVNFLHNAEVEITRFRV